MSTLLTIFNKLTEDTQETVFMYYQALYWYCTENHEGQFTELYSILSTLPYKPALTEKAEDVDYDWLGFPISHSNMLLLATALRLYAVVQYDSYTFMNLSYITEKDVYLAEYRNYYTNDGKYDTRYDIYKIYECGRIECQTLTD